MKSVLEWARSVLQPITSGGAKIPVTFGETIHINVLRIGFAGDMRLPLPRK